MADTIEGREEIVRALLGTFVGILNDWPKADAALAEFGAGKDLGLKFVSLSEEQAFADADLAAGPDQTLPIVGMGGELAGQQNLDAAVEEIARGGIVWADGMSAGAFAATVESGRKDAGVVEDHEIAGLQQVGKFAERVVGIAAGDSLQMEHAGTVASSEGSLGDKVLGKMEVEVGNQHGVRL